METVYSDAGGGSFLVGAVDGGLEVCRVKIWEGGGGEAMATGHDEPSEATVGLAGLLGLALVAFFRRTTAHCCSGARDDAAAAA